MDFVATQSFHRSEWKAVGVHFQTPLRIDLRQLPKHCILLGSLRDSQTLKGRQCYGGIDMYLLTPLSAHFKLFSLQYHRISKLLIQEVLGRRSPYPEKRPVCSRHSSRLVQQSDHIDPPFDPDRNGSAHLRGRCSTVLGIRPTQRQRW